MEAAAATQLWPSGPPGRGCGLGEGRQRLRALAGRVLDTRERVAWGKECEI